MRLILSVRLALIAAALFVPSASARAQSYPDKPIRLVVGFPPGGINDIVARIVGQKVSDSLKQPVVIENRSGAGGTVGADYVAKSTPDGYTLLLGSVSNLSMAPSLHPNLPYDPTKDFAPIALVAASPNVLVANPKFPIGSIKDLIALAKQQPGQINYASAGIGTSNHLTMELLKVMAGIDLLHVPYRGDAPATSDVIAGQVPLIFPTMPVALPHVKAGTLRAIAVSSMNRSAFLPDVPTVAESGALPDFAVDVWVGIVAPAGTPKAIVDKINAEVNEAIKQADVRERLAVQGAEPAGGTPEQFKAYIAAETQRWSKVAAAAKITKN